jgi:predicted small lipoprotein YifL
MKSRSAHGAANRGRGARGVTALLLVGLLAALVACGQKGALYLPQKGKAVPAQPSDAAPPPATPGSPPPSQLPTLPPGAPEEQTTEPPAAPAQPGPDDAGS